ncbi:hypothetical protein QZH41_017215, partial [Actinostola sp. cb2023]
MADGESKSFSFTFSKKKETKQLQKAGKNVLGTEKSHKDEGEDVDFIRSAEGNKLQSVKPKEVIKELIIPLQKKNRWILPTDGTDGLDRQAAEELVKDVLRDLEAKDETNDDMSIPILMRNRLPNVEGYEQDERLDIAMRPAESTFEDYESMPVSAFGTAMLRGMGWKKGEAIGGTVKGFCEPIEFIQRSKGLGLGAERKNQPNKKKRKPGDVEEKKIGPIKEKDGRVRHVKGVGEIVIVEEPLDFRPGVGAVIEKGPHQDLFLQIISVDVDNSRVTIRLHISGENTTIHQFHVRLVDEEEYKDLSSDKRKDNQKDSDHRSGKRRKDYSIDDDYSQSKHKDDRSQTKHHKSHHTGSTSNGDAPKEPKTWLYPQIRVRIISKDYKKGRYYNTKVRMVCVLDVTSKSGCVCETQDGRVLEGVSQSMLETVVPKSENAYIRIVRGSDKG